MPPKSALYTKTGDKGTTRLVDGSTVDKFDPRVEAYGAVDELNSHLGEVRSRLTAVVSLRELDPVFAQIQNALFNIGSRLACADVSVREKLPEVSAKHVSFLENEIDRLDAELPPLKNFILPAGSPAACALQIARTVCRRAERRVAELASEAKRPDRDGTETVAATATATDTDASLPLVYLNRLSDLLFAAARYSNLKTQVADVTWSKS